MHLLRIQIKPRSQHRHSSASGQSGSHVTTTRHSHESTTLAVQSPQ
ncbi:unnamed protein product, partial [Rotaria sordida]